MGMWQNMPCSVAAPTSVQHVVCRHFEEPGKYTKIKVICVTQYDREKNPACGMHDCGVRL